MKLGNDISLKWAFFKSFGNLGSHNVSLGSLGGHPEKGW
jgi:hypothetical protein